MKQGKVFEKWVYWSNYMISHLGIHNQKKQMCDDFPHSWAASSWLKVLKSSQVGPNWFKSHDVGSGKRLSVAKMLALWLLLGTHTLSSRTESAGVRPLHWVIKASSLERTALRLRVSASEDVSRNPTHGQQRSGWCLSERKGSDLWGNCPVVKSEFE